ncbi:MAG: peptidoglycan DD-metalloendopeptidase family protein [Gammaproteobacteria bacterium]|nr:peptidoglycan DD-metalloendopeptidase family protein [Gammaproteobacteria bacterium]MDH5591678.1 peptidoglycan DD-metalloendopeptidase family protein [Gammaproteobacteria bacterium]
MRIVLLLLIFMLTSCGGGQAVAPVGSYGYGSKAKTSQSNAGQVKLPTVYKVKKGDTLYSISWRYGMDYKILAKINHIRPPYRIFVGQKLLFKSYRNTESTTKSTATASKKTTKTTKPEPKGTASNQRLTWRWPTKGEVISTYSKSAAGRKGINISGKSGQQVVAAASGKVVYSGNGLPRYGNLLIIKHNDVYLSAYAHNKSLLVKEGQYVKSGQKIALLGRTGTQRDQLHFEIRRNGKPVDPMRFLPKQR